jgi:hypothetical protein
MLIISNDCIGHSSMTLDASGEEHRLELVESVVLSSTLPVELVMFASSSPKHTLPMSFGTERVRRRAPGKGVAGGSLAWMNVFCTTPV